VAKRLTDAEAAALDRRVTRGVGLAMMIPGALILVVCIGALLQFRSVRVLGCAMLIGLPLFLAGAQRVFFPRAFKSEGHRDLD
jgi:hypothetical protein